MRELLVGPVLPTSALAGVVALLAPCRVSVMLRASLATVFRRRSRILAATVVFAAGVATVIVPVGLGASALAAAFQRWHMWLFGAGGPLMAAGGVAVLAGWSLRLPLPDSRSPAGEAAVRCTTSGCSPVSPRPAAFDGAPFAHGRLSEQALRRTRRRPNDDPEGR